MRARLAACALLLAPWACFAAGCDDGQDAGDGGKTLTVYSSFPLQGDSEAQSKDIVRAMKMALEQAGGRAGNFRIRYVSLDDAAPATGTWEPDRVSANARRAVRDRSAIAYLGEFSSRASAISIPIVNGAGILQVSPSNTYVGLTRAEGAASGEPDRFYPSGRRSYGRVVPADHIQAAAIARYIEDSGAADVYVVNDQGVYGKGMGDSVARIARTQGLTVLGNDPIDPEAESFHAEASKIRRTGADAVFFGGVTPGSAVRLFEDVFAANPDIKMFGPGDLADPSFTEEVGSKLEPRIFVTHPTLEPRLYPPAARKFFAAFKARFGGEPERYAIYGYEAMSVVLDAIERAGDRGDDRRAVVEAFFDTSGRNSVLGRYDIDENGDTTLSDYGGYRIEGGQLVFQSVIKTQGVR